MTTDTIIALGIMGLFYLAVAVLTVILARRAHKAEHMAKPWAGSMILGIICMAIITGIFIPLAIKDHAPWCTAAQAGTTPSGRSSTCWALPILLMGMVGRSWVMTLIVLVLMAVWTVYIVLAVRSAKCAHASEKWGNIAKYCWKQGSLRP